MIVDRGDFQSAVLKRPGHRANLTWKQYEVAVYHGGAAVLPKAHPRAERCSWLNNRTPHSHVKIGSRESDFVNAVGQSPRTTESFVDRAPRRLSSSRDY